MFWDQMFPEKNSFYAKMNPFPSREIKLNLGCNYTAMICWAQNAIKLGAESIE